MRRLNIFPGIECLISIVDPGIPVQLDKKWIFNCEDQWPVGCDEWSPKVFHIRIPSWWKGDACPFCICGLELLVLPDGKCNGEYRAKGESKARQPSDQTSHGPLGN